MKIKKGLSLSNIIFLVVIVIIVISSAVAMFFIGGYTSKTIPIIIAAMAVGSITNGIHQKFFIKEKENDERNISLENKAKAKAFDVMQIIFGILIIIYVLLKANLLTIALAVVAYLIILTVFMTSFSKYHKEM
ncbi:hypothetical protein [Clostridium estertheticum]|uniref:hypothetical protein n=1 Tax=Clostridium estertheticum TaxID=238834 RepID=UPI001CF2671D|nr:hypothetical protein [Clostridium estertheticum]MCB2342401.1 hypothetical protein [Clostridium estertheticum]